MIKQIKAAKRRGVILLTTLFFMILFSMLAFALYQLSPSDSRTALRERTLAEAHFGCTAGIRNVKEWISAVTKPGSDVTKPEALGENFSGHTVVAGSTTYASLHNDPFSVPAGDPNFEVTTLGALTCPYGHFKNSLGVPMTGPDFLGIQANVNLQNSGANLDYDGLVAQKNNWLVLKTSTATSGGPLKLGEFEIFTYVVPSANTRAQLLGTAAPGLRTYLITCIAYRNTLPVMRARCVLKETSAADYAYRANVGARDIMNNPVTWNVVDRNSVLFDGPVHTNEVPYLSVPLGYWNDALAYLDPLTKKNPKRAFLGGLTFSGTDAGITASLAFDGVGWFKGNYGGSNIDNRPFDNSGNPIPSTAWASASTPVPDTGPILNRYDRLIAGGRPAISKVSSVPLPDDNNDVKVGAFGSTAATGLAADAVAPTQINGSLQTPTVPAATYRDAGGTVRTISAKTNTSDFGIFVNPKSGTTEAAGGVVIKGEARNMTLEVTDDQGRVVTNDAALQAGTAVGNPTIRMQSTVTSYDSNSGTAKPNYAPGTPVDIPGTPTATVPAWTTATVPAVPASITATVATVPAVPHATVATVPASTVPASGPLHGIPGCPSPNVTYSTASGSSIPTYTCPHPKPPTVIGTVPAVPAWTTATVPAVPSSNVATVATVAAIPHATVPATAGTTTTSTPMVATGTSALDPFPYKAQDWVVDVKNVATVITPTMLTPTTVTTTDQRAWQYGVGTEVNTGGNSKAADLPGQTPASLSSTGALITGNAQKGITTVYRHDGANDVTGTPVTTSQPIGVGKILLYKQSRSDANRVDVFVLDRPSTIPTTAQPGGLNGGVFASGNIHALRGVNMDPKTIGTSYGDGTAATEKGINIIDNLWQYGTTRGQKPISANHGLGLVGPKMNVQTREASFSGKSLYIYATIISGSSKQNGTTLPYQGLDVSSPNNADTTNFTRRANTTDTNATSRLLQIFGGLTEQQTRARLDGSRGWGQQMTFDKELSLKPPPFFPSSNVLVPMAYTQESVLGK